MYNILHSSELIVNQKGVEVSPVAESYAEVSMNLTVRQEFVYYGLRYIFNLLDHNGIVLSYYLGQVVSHVLSPVFSPIKFYK